MMTGETLSEQKERETASGATEVVVYIRVLPLFQECGIIVLTLALRSFLLSAQAPQGGPGGVAGAGGVREQG